jgi:hypothetical protein
VFLIFAQAIAQTSATLSLATSKTLTAITAPVASLVRITSKFLSAATSPIATLVRSNNILLDPLRPYIRAIRDSYIVQLFAGLFIAKIAAQYVSNILDTTMPAACDLPPIVAALQKQSAAFDFGPTLDEGVTLTGTPTITVTVDVGTDPLPQDIITAGPTVGTVSAERGGSGVENGAVLYQLGNLVAGVRYLLVCSCATTNGDIRAGSTHVAGIVPV